MTAIDPRFKSTIPVHAGVTEFTPASLDPLGLRTAEQYSTTVAAG